jgi:hypothetical protein
LLLALLFPYLLADGVNALIAPVLPHETGHGAVFVGEAASEWIRHRRIEGGLGPE